jgi:hypothetical protein
MTKKHFEALAAALRQSQIDFKGKFAEQVGSEDAARRIADVCARFNPNFDRARFLKACGVEG